MKLRTSIEVDVTVLYDGDPGHCRVLELTEVKVGNVDILPALDEEQKNALLDEAYAEMAAQMDEAAIERYEASLDDSDWESRR